MKFNSDRTFRLVAPEITNVHHRDKIIELRRGLVPVGRAGGPNSYAGVLSP